MVLVLRSGLVFLTSVAENCSKSLVRLFDIEDPKIPAILRAARRLIELGIRNRKIMRGVHLEVRDILAP